MLYYKLFPSLMMVCLAYKFNLIPLLNDNKINLVIIMMLFECINFQESFHVCLFSIHIPKL